MTPSGSPRPCERVAEILGPTHPRRERRRAPRDRLRVPRPARRAARSSSSSTRSRPSTRRARAPAGRPPSPPTSSTPCAPPTSRRSLRRPCSTSTSTRRRWAEPTPWPGPRDSARCPLSALCGLLARTRLTVRPVRDLSSRVRSTAYEHPESLKEQTYLRTGGDYWPFATSTSRRVDYDHPTAYDDTGPRPAADRLPQLRPTGPTTSPLEDPRGLPVTPVRRRTLRLAHPARTGLPRRPPRDPTDRPRQGLGDLRGAGRRGPLLHLGSGMRIVSLIPSATEILFAVGAGDDVVGVTFECDHPPAARERRVVSDLGDARGPDARGRSTTSSPRR